MGVVAEFDSEDTVAKILTNSRKLAGSSISMERDLNAERQTDKKVLLQLKRDILSESKEKRVTVRDDRIKIEDFWCKWNQAKQLITCKYQHNAESIINSSYASPLSSVKFKYN